MDNRKSKIHFILFVLFVFALSSSASPVQGADFTDAVGRTVTVNAAPQRIVSLAPSITEILYYLGLGQYVVGVTQFSYYPIEAASKPKVGSYINLNIEKILTLSPDLVIGTKDGNKPGVVDLLEQARIPVYIINPRNINQVIETVARMGQVCGQKEKADALAARLKERVDRVRSKIKSTNRPLVFLQINFRPIITANKTTFLHDLIVHAGGRNMAADLSLTYPRISIEEVIRKKPETIMISSMDRGGHFEKARQTWLKWTSIPAVRNSRVHLIDSDLIDRPAPRIVDGLEAMARIIHPEIKWDEAPVTK